MFVVHKTLSKPATVTRARYCYFSSNVEMDLVLQRGCTEIEVWRIERRNGSRLWKLGEWSFFGEIMDFRSILLPLFGHCLVLSFGRARAVILRYEEHKLRTISLHNFESSPQLPVCLNTHVPLLRVHPKCILMQVYLDFWALIPISDSELEEKQSTPYLPSFIINTKELQNEISNVRDIQFMNGYLDPTVAVLYTPLNPCSNDKQTLTTRVESNAPRCTFLSLSLEKNGLNSQLFSTILPFTAHSLIPCEYGVMIICTNSLIYVSQSCPAGVAVGLNAYFQKEPISPQTKISDYSKMGIRIEKTSTVAFVEPNKLLISMDNGDLWSCELKCTSVNWCVEGFSFKKIAKAPPASCIEPIFDCVFLGSANGHSLLLTLGMGCDEDLVEINDENSYKVADIIPSFANLKDGMLCQINQKASLFALGGYEHGSSYNIFQQTIDPILYTKFKMGGARQIWTMGQDLDSLLVISGDHKTMVFSISEDLQQINTEFETNEKSIFVGQMKKNLVQICEYKIITLNLECKKLQKINLGLITYGTCCDELVAVMVDLGARVYNEDLQLVFETSASFVHVFEDFCAFASNEDIEMFNKNTKKFHEFKFKEQIIETVMNDDDFLYSEQVTKKIKIEIPDSPQLYRKQTGILYVFQDKIFVKTQDLKLVLETEGIIQAFIHSFGPRIQDVFLIVVKKSKIEFYQANLSTHVYFAKLDKVIEYKNQCTLHFFTNISKFKGIFIDRLKEKSVWCFFKNGVFIHTMTQDNLTGFAQFNKLGTSGFLMATSTHLIISTLDSFDFANQVPYKQIRTKLNAHAACYHSEAQIFGVITSTPEDFKLVIEVPDQQEHHAPASLKVTNLTPDLVDRELPNGSYSPQMRLFSLNLVSSLNLICGDLFTFEPYEHVTAICTVTLDCKQAATGKKQFIAIGTSFTKGEDVSTRGKLYVFDVVSVVPQPGHPETAHKLKLITFEDVKSPVSAVTAFHTHILVGTGAKIIVYDLEEMENLVGVAFHDAHIFVSAIKVFKSFILVGDFYKSVLFLVWQEDPPKLQLVGKDHHSLAVTCLSFLCFDSKAGFLVGDDSGGLNLMIYSPFNIQSYGGTKLLRWGDFYLGTKAACLVPFRSDMDVVRFNAFFLCRDGSIGVIMPVSEVFFKRHLLLYNELANSLIQNGGLHPKSFRHHLSHERLFSNNQNTFVDLNLTFLLNFCPMEQQQKHSKAIGTNFETIKQDLNLLIHSWTVL